MAETVKKTNRKHKLVPREFEEYEDENDACFQLSQITTQINNSNLSLLPKIKDKINDDHIFKPSTPVNFSVQVEVEACEEEMETYEEYVDDDMPIQKVLESNYVSLTSEELRSEIEKSMTQTTSQADKLIEIEILNYLGKYPQPIESSYHNNKIQEAFQEWKLWHFQSKSRFAIIAYRCYICKIGWWHLDPFRNHILQHEEINVSIDTFHHDCFVVAYEGDMPVDSSQVTVEGKCWQCLKSYEEHNIHKRITPFYQCKGCNVKKVSCRTLFAHEGVCQRYQKIIFQNQMATEELWACEMCEIVCLTSKRYEEHLLLSHLVRSDLPVPSPTFQTCNYCHMNYIYFMVHACATKPDSHKCMYCFRRFQTKCLLDMHQKYTKKNYNCKVCTQYLETQCMELEHMVRHSKNYVSVYKCKSCTDNILFAYEEGMIRHTSKLHNKLKKHRGYETVIVPITCMTLKWTKLEPEIKTYKTSAPKVSRTSMPRKQAKIIEAEQELAVIQAANLKTAPIKVYARKNNILTLLPYKFEASGAENSQDSVYSISEDDDTNMSIDKRPKSPDNILHPCTSFESLQNIPPIDMKDGITDNIHDYDVINNGNVQGECVIKDASNSSQDTISIKQEISNESSNQDSALHNKVKSCSKEENEKEKGKCVTSDSLDTIKIKQEINEDQDGELKDKANFNQEDNIQVYDEINNRKQQGERVIHEISDSSQDTITIKQEIIDEDDTLHDKVNSIQEKSESFENIKIKTEVSIKEEKEDYNEFDEEMNEDIKAEHDACLAELSKVFQASKQAGSIQLSGICLNEELLIKEESDEELYEDDIIKLDADYETKTEVISDSETSKHDSETDNEEDSFSLEPESELMSDQYEEVKSDDIAWTTYRNTKGKLGNATTRKKKIRKIYKCNKCAFEGVHRAYRYHVENVCPRKKHIFQRSRTLFDNHFTQLNPQKMSWKDYRCTKCKTKFTGLMSYVAHFRKHDLLFGTCPECLKEYSNISLVTTHVKEHIKMSFMKIQVLNCSSYITSKSTGLYQCKTCPEKVKYDDFFTHWEKHLKLGEGKRIKTEEDRISADGDMPVYDTMLPPDKLKQILDQLLGPLHKNKTCSLCSRPFFRRNDCKRHLIEHLVKDAAAHRPKYNSLRCQLCQEDFMKADRYKTHMRNHGALPIYECEMCNKQFSDSSNFAKHRKTHNIQVMICDICRKKFHSRAQIEKHLEMHRTTEPIICQPCNRKFFCSSSYKKHCRSAHMKLSHKFGCDVCSKKFVKLRELWDHRWQVHKQRNINADCTVCGKEFRKVNDLKAHLRNEHSTFTVNGYKVNYRRCLPGTVKK